MEGGWGERGERGGIVSLAKSNGNMGESGREDKTRQTINDHAELLSQLHSLYEQMAGAMVEGGSKSIMR